jgi:cell division septation protein DedD
LANDTVNMPRELPQPPQFTAFPFTVEPAAVATLDAALASDARSVLVRAYGAAAAAAPQACHLSVTLLAAIGQVESGSIGGRVLYGHRVVPPIYGPMLTGGPFATIHDTDGGRLDGSAVWDRAVGPMQFIPGTWAHYGRDGDGDSIADPQNVFDAAFSAAGYLCLGPRDLSRPADLSGAILSYNASASYLATVLRWMSYFQLHGLGSISTVAFPVSSGAGLPLPSTTSPAGAPPVTPPQLPAPLSGPTGTGTTPVSTGGTSGAIPGTTPAPGTTTSTPPSTTSDPAPTTTSDPAPTTTSDPAPTTTTDPAPSTSDPAPTTTTTDPAPSTSDPTTSSDPTTTSTAEPTSTSSG